MRFCTDCGSFMVNERDALVCPRCGKRLNPSEVLGRKKKEDTSKIVSLIVKKVDGLKVNHPCPKCGCNEAYRMVSVTSGEHAGVKQDRSIERYRCSKCDHTWSED